MTDVTDAELILHLPRTNGTAHDQDAEWCMLETNEGTRRVRFHDYDEIYTVPGLYERIFYEELRCTSPRVVRRLIEDTLEDRGMDAEALTVLDVGAGNGMVAEQLDEMGASTIVGVDIIEEAAVAAERDRPGLYDDYRVVDLTDPAPEHDAALRKTPFTCMTTVAALGYGDMPPEAFSQALEYVEEGGLIAFTLKDRFVTDADPSGFSRLVKSLHEDGTLEPIAERRYRHRVSMAGEPLHYVAYVAEKAAK